MKMNFNMLYSSWCANVNMFNKIVKQPGITYQQKLSIANTVNHIGNMLWGMSYRMPKQILTFLHPACAKPQNFNPVITNAVANKIKQTMQAKPQPKPVIIPSGYRSVPTTNSNPYVFNQTAINKGNKNLTAVNDKSQLVAGVNQIHLRKKHAKKHIWTDIEIKHLLHGDVAWLEQIAKVTYDQMMSKTNELGYCFNYGKPVSKPKVYNRLVIACHPDWESEMKAGIYTNMLNNKIRLSAICICAKKHGYAIPSQYANWNTKQSRAIYG